MEIQLDLSMAEATEAVRALEKAIELTKSTTEMPLHLHRALKALRDNLKYEIQEEEAIDENR